MDLVNNTSSVYSHFLSGDVQEIKQGKTHFLQLEKDKALRLTKPVDVIINNQFKPCF